jgi:hypothetical protein
MTPHEIKRELIKTSTHHKGRFRSRFALCALALAVALATGCGRASTDLTVRVTDQEGNPIPGAMVGLLENDQTLLADQEGKVAWQDLTEKQASLVVAAQGYVLHTAVIQLERGVTKTTLALVKKAHDVPYQPPVSP